MPRPLAFLRLGLVAGLAAVLTAGLAACTTKAEVTLEIRETPSGVQSVEIGIYRGQCPDDVLRDRALNNYDPALVGTVILERGTEPVGSFLLDQGSYCVVLLGRSPTCEVVAGHEERFSLSSRGDQTLTLAICPAGACAPLSPDPVCGPAVGCRDGRGICENREVGFTPPVAQDAGPRDTGSSEDSSIRDSGTSVTCPAGDLERSCEAGKPCDDPTSDCSEIALCGYPSGHVFRNGNSCTLDDSGVATRDPKPRESMDARSPVTLEDALLFPCFSECLASGEGVRTFEKFEMCATCCSGNDVRCGVTAAARCMAQTCHATGLSLEALLQDCYALRTEVFFAAGMNELANQVQACRVLMEDQTGLQWTVSTPITREF